MNKFFVFLGLFVGINYATSAQYTQQISNVRNQARIFADATI